MKIRLYQEHKKIGRINFPMSNFLSENIMEREFYKIFSGKELPLLKWELNFTVGIHDKGFVNVTRIKLSEFEGIFLPNRDYYSCEPLPAEWFSIINYKKDTDGYFY